MSNKYLVYFAVALLAIAMGFVVYTQNFSNQHRGYTAVFMTNNQVYFGRLVSQNSFQVRLTDVFYLNDSKSLSSTDPNEDISLIKMGKELHAPTDFISLSRSQIVSIQTMGNTSKISDAIEKYRSSR